MDLRFGFRGFARDFQRGIFLVTVLGLGGISGFLVVAALISIIVELAGGSPDNWYWVGYLGGAFYGVRTLGSAVDIALQI